jgi:hypothetical protein
MRAESPRKSSTSSARPRRARARYLGVEVAGEPVLSPASWAATLRDALSSAGASRVAFRVVRSDGARAVARVDRADAPVALRAWNGRLTPERGGLGLRTVRTWGTLVGAKAWLVAGPATGRKPDGSGSPRPA